MLWQNSGMQDSTPRSSWMGADETQLNGPLRCCDLQEQYKTPFLPLMGGGVEAKYDDLESARAAITKGRTCAVFVEPLQGEGGINSSTQCASLINYYKRSQSLCKILDICASRARRPWHPWLSPAGSHGMN